MTFKYYQSDIEIKVGDQIKYHGDLGKIEFVVTEPTGDPALDWFLEDSPSGGIGIAAEGWGRVFLPAEEISDEEDLEFVSRSPES